jgi:hypothetical protein
MSKSNKVADRPSKTIYVYPPYIDILKKAKLPKEFYKKGNLNYNAFMNKLIENYLIANNLYIDLELINWKVDDDSGNCWFEYFIGETRCTKTLTLSEIEDYADWKGWLIRYDIDRESYEITGLEYALFDLATNWHDAEELLRHCINLENKKI